MDVTSSNWFRNLNKAVPHSRCIKSRQLQSKDKSRSLNPGSHFNKGLPLSPSSPSSALPVGDCPLKSTALKTLSHFMQITAFTVNTTIPELC